MLQALRFVLLVAVALEFAGLSYAQTETVLHTFNGFEGSYPNSLIFDAQGNLYGTTYIGGTYSYGTIFRLTPDIRWLERDCAP
jgi:uncharacterized repeat protein (TIGR03803 family)